MSELVDQGRQLFLSSGCANCHALTLDQQRLNTTLHAKAFSEIDVDGGCLAARPPANVPQYDLSDSQRAAIRLAAEEMKRRGHPG